MDNININSRYQEVNENKQHKYSINIFEQHFLRRNTKFQTQYHDSAA